MEEQEDIANSQDIAGSDQSSLLSSVSQNDEKTSRIEFFVDWSLGTSGTVGKGGVRHTLNDFALKLITVVNAGLLTGFCAKVKRERDGCVRDCFFTNSALNTKLKFIDQINYSFGGGAMSCGFDSNNHVTLFGQFLKRSAGTNLQTKEAVIHSGEQSTGVYAMNSECFLSQDGEILSESNNPHVWLKRESLIDSDKIVMDDITARVQKPLGVHPAVEFYTTLKKCLGHNFLPGLLVVSGSLLSFHYRKVITLYGGCPITVASGPSGTGKSTSIKAGLALLGTAHNGMCSKGTNAGMLERSSRSTLPYGIDDPAKSKVRGNYLDIGELCIDLFNGQKTINMRSGVSKPLSIPVIATNFGADEMDRVLSRILSIPFGLPSCGPVTIEECRTYMAFQSNCEGGKYSCMVGWVIRAGKELATESGKKRVQELRQEIQTLSLHLLVARNVTNWALCLFFLEKFLQMVHQSGVDHMMDEDDDDKVVTKEDITVIMDEAKEFIMKKSCSHFTHSQTDPGPLSCGQDLVHNTLQKLCDKVSHKDLTEVLTFMRVGTTLHDRPIVALCMSKVRDYVRVSDEFTVAIRKTKMGEGGIKREFLKSGCSETDFSRKKNSSRLSCLGIYLDMLPSGLKQQVDKALSPHAPVRKQKGQPHSEQSEQEAELVEDQTNIGVKIPHTKIDDAELTMTPTPIVVVDEGDDPTTELTKTPTPIVVGNEGDDSTTELTKTPTPIVVGNEGDDPTTELTKTPNPNPNGSVQTKRKLPAPTLPNPKRQTRQNTTLPAWNKTINAANPLGL